MELKLNSNAAIFYKLLYHPAIYSQENGNIVMNPRIMLGVKTVKNEILFFNIYPELCEAWQEPTPFTTKKTLKRLESRLKSKMFDMNDKSIDRISLEKKLCEIIAFDM